MLTAVLRPFFIISYSKYILFRGDSLDHMKHKKWILKKFNSQFFGEKFFPFVNTIYDAGSWNLAWILPCIIWTCIPKIISLAFFVWSEFIHFYVFLKILSVNYGRMKKARDTKFYMHISSDETRFKINGLLVSKTFM